MTSCEIPKDVLQKKKQFIAKLSSVTYRNDFRKYRVEKWSLGRLLRDGG